ncbi:hypothetical protein DTL42_07795 [Bremerella cremea]|uniref:Uncharacterized protein n=1 Tax=Bremerella cremea TaxID=1031537 RepID=A0A368KST2_9BACT|nr:hypothetical protein [Bremerella cremea]RCS52730.1 hypothetical protein DTL42_07795 [Bremerella cremea]
MQPTSDNPFESPTVLEQIPPSPDQEQSLEDQMPSLVALTWMLFLFTATIHGMVSLNLGIPWMGFVSILSGAAGFVVLYPSPLAWGLGLGYASLMSLVMLVASAVGFTESRPPTLYELSPLVLYFLIVAILLKTSRRYYFDSPEQSEPEEG